MIPYSAQTKQGREEIYEIIDKVIEEFWQPSDVETDEVSNNMME